MTNANDPVHLAVDLGASSGRVLAGRVHDSGIDLEELHRFSNGGVHLGRRLVWNLLGQWEQVVEGLRRGAAQFGNRVRSVGADTWGVDYVLLDRNDDQVGPCFHYRDARTRGMIERAFERLSREKIFQATGLQFIEINTVYQLLAMRLEGSPLLDIAERFLMVPDFLHWQLTGEKVNEYTNASTTQLLDANSGEWSMEVLRAFELPESIFSPPLQPGTCLGTLLPSVTHQTQLHSGVEVILPATHDTGSAVLAVPANSFAKERPDWCYISCGTWSLMGAELARPVLTEACQMFNFTNEGGVQGSVRLLKNIAGLWIVQQCREQWKREGQDWSWNRLIELADQAPSMTSIIDTDSEMFIAPASMPAAIREFCRQTNQPIPETEGQIIRCALESLVLRYRLVLGNLEQLLGHSFSTIHMVGGGVQNRMLCQFTADACGRPVVAGPVEATALGNVMMQAIGTGRLGSIVEARKLIRGAKDIHHYEPQAQGRWDEGFARLKQLALVQP
jgi:rhamnulokinase